MSTPLPKELAAELAALVERVRALGPEALAALRERFARLVAESTNAADGDDDAVWHGMIGRCPPMLALRGTIEKFARAPMPVLIRGESGTGKDVVARILHRIGPRRERPFVAENCAAIPETLLESVLFGHVKGAFTGAIRDHDGHFVAADQGTLFLDEIGDMPLAMQAKLLRALQNGEIRPVGSERVRKVDVRVIAATNRDLEAKVRDGSFRQDLFYRLNVLQLELPPLRTRGDDVVLLARRLLASAAAQTGRDLRLTAATERALAACPWPGNIRQLQNEIQRLVALADGPDIGVEDLSPELVAAMRAGDREASG
ncbi:MAG: sigma 54-interacting transcriptional regulator [Planctomycetes bacterium]|nr:sigma 54-interacting transcriptional regulator [Planctomycetota bacterium]